METHNASLADASSRPMKIDPSTLALPESDTQAEVTSASTIRIGPASAPGDFWRGLGFQPDPNGTAAVPEGLLVFETAMDSDAQDRCVTLLKGLEAPPRLWMKTDSRQLILFRTADPAVAAKLRPHLPTGMQIHEAGMPVVLPDHTLWPPGEHSARAAEDLSELTAESVNGLVQPEPVATRNPLLPFSLRGQSEKFRQMVVEARPLLGEVCLRGQVTIWYAGANTGKTLIALSLLIDAVREARIAAGNVFYVNADDNGAGFATKLQLMDDIGAHALAPGFKGFRAPELISLLHKMADNDEARGVFVVIDTLKKFTQLMDKKESSEFAQACRRVAMMGGTVLGLAHTTKQPNADGSPRYAGTTDLVDDADAAYTLNPFKTGDGTLEKVVEFRCFKSRGACADSAAYAFAAEKGITYEELLASVRPVDPMQVDNFRRVEAQLADGEAIDVVRACIADGVNTKMLMIKEVVKRSGLSERAAIRLIERYTGNDPVQHRWRFVRRQHGAQVFELIDPAPA